MNNLENIPACLRVIARKIEDGEIEANVGVLTLRLSDPAAPLVDPVVFGFGKEVDPFLEMELAAYEIKRLSAEN